MEKKIYTVAILGLGGRGADAYGHLLHKAEDRFKIVSLCDIRPARIEMFSEAFNVPKENCFTDEDEFFAEKRADLLLIATPDTEHVRHALKGFALGYHLMIEKPLTESEEECKQLLAAQKKAGTKALVCHVLRYAPAFMKMAELLDEGKIGKLVMISALERVGASHQAHSYVRGNWRNRNVAAPMILAKCCHDLDLLQFYAKSKCKTISSVGDLTYFKSENAPAGATARCLGCPHQDSCPYSAKTQYLTNWKKEKPEDCWPHNVVVNAPITEEKLLDALKNGPYGRCVYYCDNDVVDHQITEMVFENGVKAVLTMTAFTATGGRRIHFHGTLGDMVLDEDAGSITLHQYGKDREIMPIADLMEKGYGHGGGDSGIINALYAILSGEQSAATALEASVESHLMGIRAEESRLQGGKMLNVH
ncbi:MAG: Gfo/Idh/MocA family oxidoreductase [Clostridiales bacterium]|nr:Gfo/Idh/MocA family oxidoreductase [Clostridiales bacterium]